MSEIPDDPYTFRIPLKRKDEEKCPLPIHIHKACRDIMGPKGYDCVKYCWRNIRYAIIPLGKRTFIIDPNIKEFDFHQLSKKPPARQAPAEKNPFDW